MGSSEISAPVVVASARASALSTPMTPAICDSGTSSLQLYVWPTGRAAGGELGAASAT